MRRFEPFLGIGVQDLAPNVSRQEEPGRLALLHVGRAVRTKGLRDTVRALALLGDLPGITLTSIGGGEEVAICRSEAERLGVADRVRVLGRLERTEIEAHYRDSDTFVFPSFRESMGGVLYEAMRWGLPVVTVDCGGPGWIVDESCGLKVSLTSPEIMPGELAQAIRRLAQNPALRRQLGAGARAKVAAEALWKSKAERMVALYAETLAERAAERAGERVA
jgi:glycosyltransferase involved in cell wall biosynthesis